MLKGILFDVDGVLADSREANAVFFQRILRKSGYPAPSVEDIERCFHMTMKETLRKLIPNADDQEIERVWKLGHERDVYPINMMQITPHLSDVLTELSKNYKLGVVTGRVRVGLEEFFNRSHTKHFFKTHIAYEDYARPKPDPEPLLLAAKELDLPTSELVYVGDSQTDIEAAWKARMRSIFFGHTKLPKADATVSSLVELPGLISEW